MFPIITYSPHDTAFRANDSAINQLWSKNHGHYTSIQNNLKAYQDIATSMFSDIVKHIPLDNNLPIGNILDSKRTKVGTANITQLHGSTGKTSVNLPWFVLYNRVKDKDCFNFQCKIPEGVLFFLAYNIPYYAPFDDDVVGLFDLKTNKPVVQDSFLELYCEAKFTTIRQAYFSVCEEAFI